MTTDADINLSTIITKIVLKAWLLISAGQEFSEIR